MSFTSQVREELAHIPSGPVSCALAEASALLRLGGCLELRGGVGVGYLVETHVGAVARRTRSLLGSVLGARTRLEVHRPSGLRSTTAYRLRLVADADQALQRLGLLDGHGRPVAGVPHALLTSDAEAVAYLRGALMAAGSVSDPRRAPHLEIRAPSERTARELAEVLATWGQVGARAGRHGGWRVTVKSGAGIGEVLARVGAHTSFLRWDGERLRRELRADANRAANADRANLERAVVASSRQATAVQRLMATPAWAEVPDELREVALARLANPEASMAELGALLEPPVAKSSVHRRLIRLDELARRLDLA